MTNTLGVSELLPCPFCGGEASDAGHIRFSKPLNDAWWEDESEITEAFYVNCIKCGAVARSGIVGGCRTKDEAVERWNTRATLRTVPSNVGVSDRGLIEALERIVELENQGPIQRGPAPLLVQAKEIARAALASVSSSHTKTGREG